MEWPVARSPVPDEMIPVSQVYYLAACRRPSDPIIVWGTEVDVTEQRRYLRFRNDDSPVLLSPAHVLLQSVGHALARHPEFNRRVIGRKLYQYHDVNLLMPFSDLRSGEVELSLIEKADQVSLQEIAQHLWRELHGESVGQNSAAYGRASAGTRRVLARWAAPFYLWLLSRWNLPLSPTWGREQRAGAYVNCFEFRGAPPLTTYKPSKFPTETISLSVTLGPAVMKPVAVGKACEVRPVAPLYIMADHRIADAIAIGRFVHTLAELFANPARMEPAAAAPAIDSGRLAEEAAPEASALARC